MTERRNVPGDHLLPVTIDIQPKLDPREWNEIAGNLFNEIRGHGLPVSCGLGDADRLKWVNDELGHATGDRFLQAIETTLDVRHNSAELLASGRSFGRRVGGDEFKLLIVADSQGAEAYKKRVLAGVTSYLNLPENRQIKDIGAGLSLGMATASPDDNVSFEELMHQADQAMYAEKRKLLELNRKQRIGAFVMNEVGRLFGVSPQVYAERVRNFSDKK